MPATALKLNCPPRVTFEDYVSLDDDLGRVEWVDGEVIQMSPVMIEHDRLVVKLATLLNSYVEHMGLGQIIGSDFVMCFKDQSRGRQPDVAFVSTKGLINISSHYLNGAADLVIEVVSRDSQVRDSEAKFAEYARAGVREYWLIDSTKPRVDLFQLSESGRYERVEPNDQCVYASREIAGLWINWSWLWGEKQPTIIDILRMWKLI